MKWNSGQREFTEDELVRLRNRDEMLVQLLNADTIVVASPIYNFSFPATIKAWIDTIVVSSKTFSFIPGEGFKGLCVDKKALLLLVGGLDYTSGVKEFASPLFNANFRFMGMEPEQISVFGVDQNRDKIDSIINQAKDEIGELVQKWY